MTATSDRGLQAVCRTDRLSDLDGLQKGSASADAEQVRHAAGRRTTPCGTSPVAPKRHKAMSSFLARATIRVLRVAPRASVVRARYHWLRALSFWNSRKRQASWTMPRRTRALPALASPFSRRLAPLSSGGAGQACVACHSPAVAQIAREHLLHEHVRRLKADPNHASQQADHR